jgi:hypothetical protein
MAKNKKGTKENPVTAEEVLNVLSGKPHRDFVIIDASIVDDFCNYKYEITEGVGILDTHKVDGKGIILDDLRNAFVNFNVHLACIDDSFKRGGIEITDIDQNHGDEITTCYHVTGFKIKGGKDNESISLIGTKYVSLGGRLNLITPFIPIDSLSSYKWYNELKAAADRAREEVALYKEGKCRVVEEDDEEEEETPKRRKSRQLTIASPEAMAEDTDQTITDAVLEDDGFEGAKV